MSSARQVYLRVAGDKKDKISKAGSGGCVAAFAAAYCANVEVSLVVMLQAMIIWGGYSPGGILMFKIGQTMDQFQAASYGSVSSQDTVTLLVKVALSQMKHLLASCAFWSVSLTSFFNIDKGTLDRTTAQHPETRHSVANTVHNEV
jgi:hypothetical protein